MNLATYMKSKDTLWIFLSFRIPVIVYASFAYCYSLIYSTQKHSLWSSKQWLLLTSMYVLTLRTRHYFTMKYYMDFDFLLIFLNKLVWSSLLLIFGIIIAVLIFCTYKFLLLYKCMLLNENIFSIKIMCYICINIK